MGGGKVTPTDPMKEAQAEIMRMQQQYAMDEQQRKQMALETAEADKLKRSEWEGNLGKSRTATQEGINTQFSQRGLDPNDYASQIENALNIAQAGIQYGDRPAFSTDIGQNLMGDLRNKQIREYQQGIDKFAPQGFEQQAFASTADDAIIDSILAEQFGTASDSILRARDRGTLNDAGFRYAMDNLNTQKQAANSRLQGTGGGILEGYRGELGGIASGARQQAGNWDFGSSFDPTQYNTQLQGRQQELGGRLEGDIRSAIGGEQFFNVADLLQKGGIGQGATNTGMGAQGGGLLAAITDRNKKEEEQRGLGTQGTF